MREKVKMARQAPVKADEVLEVKIISRGIKGDGVAKVEGFAIFVKGAQVDELCQIKITKVLDKFAFGELLQVVGSSEPAAPVVETAEDTEDFGE